MAIMQSLGEGIILGYQVLAEIVVDRGPESLCHMSSLVIGG